MQVSITVSFREFVSLSVSSVHCTFFFLFRDGNFNKDYDRKFAVKVIFLGTMLSF